jgi:hypothetical protein
MFRSSIRKTIDCKITLPINFCDECPRKITKDINFLNVLVKISYYMYVRQTTSCFLAYLHFYFLVQKNVKLPLHSWNHATKTTQWIRRWSSCMERPCFVTEVPEMCYWSVLQRGNPLQGLSLNVTSQWRRSAVEGDSRENGVNISRMQRGLRSIVYAVGGPPDTNKNSALDHSIPSAEIYVFREESISRSLYATWYLTVLHKLWHYVV